MTRTPRILAPSPTADLAANLEYWFQQTQRPLPWRMKKSLYRTVVSELMLQQTQVATVIPYFERWMRELPNFESLANAEEETVVKLWEGLGYYTRARNLRKLAQKWVAAAQKPRTAQEWQEYPGIGPYTASAIASIQFGEHTAVMDGNVVRVISRMIGESQLFPQKQAAVKALTPIANEWIQSAENPGNFNEAMMELGATICRPKEPQCMRCPIQADCVGFREKTAHEIPRFVAKKTTTRTIKRLWIENNGKLLLQRASKNAARLQDLYELPNLGDIGFSCETTNLLFQKKRGISNERITEKIYQGIIPPSNLQAIEEHDHLQWFALNELQNITMSGPHRKWVREIRAGIRLTFAKGPTAILATD